MTVDNEAWGEEERAERKEGSSPDSLARTSFTSFSNPGSDAKELALSIPIETAIDFFPILKAP